MTPDPDPHLDRALHRLRNAMASVDIARNLLARVDDSEQADQLERMLVDATDELQQHASRVADQVARLTGRTRHRTPPDE